MGNRLIVSLCAAGFLLTVSPAFSEVVPVYPTSPNWYTIDDTTNSFIASSFVSTPSPADATYNGSANMTTNLSEAGGGSRPYLFTTLYAGLQLSTITALSYETYSVSGSSGPYLLEPTLQIDVANSPTDSSFGRLVFDPYLLGDNPAADTWVTWNPLTTAGGWVFSSSSEAATTHNSNCVIGNAAELTSACSLATILANDSDNLYVSNTYEQFGFRTGGSGVMEDSYVDQLTVGTSAGATTYDFQPAPEPSTWAMSLLAFGGLVVAARKRVTSKS